MSTLRFAADTAWGRVRLDLPSMDAHRDAVAHALALDAAHALLDALERWSGAALEIAPCTDDDGEPRITATVNDASLAPVGARIALPWRWMAASPNPVPAVLAGRGVSWERIAFTCELARFRHTPLPSTVPDEGGVLLLPPSFDASWTLRLMSSALHIAMDAPCQGLGTPWRLAVSAHATEIDDHAWRVVLADALLLHPLQCLAGNDSAIHWPHQRAAHLLPPDSTEPAARGTLMPALVGTALWIAPAATPAPNQASIFDAQPA